MKRFLILLDAAPNEPGGAPATPPASPAAVKGNPIKHPAVIALEKKCAALEDKLTGLEGWQSEVNESLEALNVGAPTKPAPVKVKAGTVPAPTPATPPAPPAPEKPKSFIHEAAQTIENDIWGAPKAS